MIKAGHIGLNAVLGFPFAVSITKMYNMEVGLIFLFIVVGFASLPDSDEYLSKLTDDERLSFLPFNITHRGITHTVYFAILLGLSAGLASKFLLHDYILIVGISAGLSVVFHTVGDIFTPMGINFIPPLTCNYTLGWFSYRNFAVNYAMFVVGLISISMVVLIGLMDIGVFGICAIGSSILFLTLVSLHRGYKTGEASSGSSP